VNDAFFTEDFALVDFIPATVFFSLGWDAAEEPFLLDLLKTADLFEPEFAFEAADFVLVTSFFDPYLSLESMLR
jgi:hypothetical protein